MSALGEEEKAAFLKLKPAQLYSKYFKKIYLMNQAIAQAVTDGVIGMGDMSLLRELPNGNKVYELPLALINKKPGSAIESIEVILDEDGGVFGVVSTIELIKDMPMRVQNADMARPFRIAGVSDQAKFMEVEVLAEEDKDLMYEGPESD
jgi:hypothetical protein